MSSEDTTKTTKTNWTDEERLALAAKLDADLEQFIGGLEKKRYTEGWPEDRWEEEMDKHPFFMKKAPEAGDDLHPMLEGLQQLKYDPMENTTEDLANTYKEDGNFYLKHNKVRMAIFSYTEGVQLKCQNPEVNAVLYNNRSAAQYFLKNYRSSLEDARKALALKPDYQKCMWRSAQCYHALGKHDETVEFCDRIIMLDAKNRAALDLRKEALELKAQQLRNERREQSKEKRKAEAVARTVEAIKRRGIRFEVPGGCTLDITPELLRPMAPLEDYPVHLDEAGGLVWPVAFCYPEFFTRDFQLKLAEDVLMTEVLVDMFTEPLECDKKHRYRPDTLSVYFENRTVGTVHKVDITKSIGEIIKNKNFHVIGGSLTFYIVPKDSEMETEYLNKERHPLMRPN